MSSKKKTKAFPSPEVVFHQPVKETSPKDYTRVEGRTKNQGDFIKSIIHNTITIAKGNAGSGKTSVAVGTAIHLYKTERVDKIVISRPAVPVYEQIGFAPGDLNEKMTPYIMPMKREFDKYLPKGEFEKLLKDSIIEIVPLCYLQGWNIEGILIVDECALLNFSQYSLILSRVCKNGKIVLIGDPLQDGGNGTGTSLDFVARKLEGLPGIGIVEFDETDNQRHELVNVIQRRLLGAEGRAPMTLEERWSRDSMWGKEHLLYPAE